MGLFVEGWDVVGFERRQVLELSARLTKVQAGGSGSTGRGCTGRGLTTTMVRTSESRGGVAVIVRATDRFARITGIDIAVEVVVVVMVTTTITAIATSAGAANLSRIISIRVMIITATATRDVGSQPSGLFWRCRLRILP